MLSGKDSSINRSIGPCHPLNKTLCTYIKVCICGQLTIICEIQVGDKFATSLHLTPVEILVDVPKYFDLKHLSPVNSHPQHDLTALGVESYPSQSKFKEIPLQIDVGMLAG